MQPFTTHRGKAALLDWSDVNTDLIIPARYLKRIERVGYGPALFADKRYAPGGAPPIDATDRPGPPDPAFPLNAPEARGASVLIVGPNFGCGSSREHAVWAVAQAGYRVLIAPGKGVGFADIFEQNAFNNGLLPIELDEAEWSRIADAARANPGLEIAVDLAARTLTVEPSGASSFVVRFEVPEAQRARLLEGLDAIAETLREAPAIDAYERSAPAWASPRA